MFIVAQASYARALSRARYSPDRVVRVVAMQRGVRSIWALCLFVASAGRSAGDDLAAGRDPPARLVTFEGDIRPIFRASCWRCHGEKSLKGELDLRSIAGVMKGGESGPVIVPGKPDE